MTGDCFGEHDHPGDLLSGLLDDELDTATAAAVAAHLEWCDACADELGGVRGIRVAVRSLPTIEPPEGFWRSLQVEPTETATAADRGEVVELPRRARRVAMANAAASIAAAAALLVWVAASPVADPVEPAVDGAVALHSSAVATWGRQGLAPASIPGRPDAVPEPFVAPVSLEGGYRLVGSFEEESGMHLLYESGQHGLSVFERPGRCDFDALPPGGRRLRVGGRDGWRLETPGIDGRVVVVDDDGVFFVVVGDEGGDAVEAAAASLPGPAGRPMAARLRGAASAALDHLAPTG